MYRKRILITKGIHRKIVGYFLCETRTYPDIRHGLLNNRAVVCSIIQDENTFSSFHKACFYSTPLEGGGVKTGGGTLKLG